MFFCSCDICLKSQVRDPTSDTGYKPGSKISKRLAQRHKLEQDERDRERGTILSAIVSARRDDNQSLPVRPADHDAFRSTTQQSGPQSPPQRSSPETETLSADAGAQSISATPDMAPKRRGSLEPGPSPLALARLNRELDTFQSEIDRRINGFNRNTPIVFSVTPSSASDPVPLPAYDDPRNILLKIHRSWLAAKLESLDEAQGRAGKGRNADKGIIGRCGGMKKQIYREFEALETSMHNSWRSAMVQAGIFGPKYQGEPVKGSVLSPIVMDTEHLFSPLARLPTEWYLRAILFMVVGLHVLCAVSQVDVEVILAATRVGIAGAFIHNHLNPDPAQVSAAHRHFFQNIPKDATTALRRFDIEPNITEYACCPTCFAIYAPTGDPNNPVYPEFCTWKDTIDQEETQCNAPLLFVSGKEKTKTSRPKRVFGYQDPVSWLARLLARSSDLEEHMEKSWSTAHENGVKDVFGAEALKNFKGPDGKLWSICPNDDLHLVFSMFVDWFNPYGNKQAGKSNSIGAIYMVCLSLPPAIRYKAENVYLVCIIPGPREPNVMQLNHLLKPIVTDFLKLWHSGVRFSRTAGKRFGRTVKCAIIPVVCDLPALRKTAGYAGHSAHNFCSFCRVQKKDIAANFDFEEWPRREWDEHLCEARIWRDATTNSAREKHFKIHGLRWSELLNLPYWDPTRFSVLDAMHNLFLGEFQHHCRRVWGLDIKSGKNRRIAPHTPEQQAENLKRAVAQIRKDSSSGLMRIRKGYITALVKYNGVDMDGKGFLKKNYVEAILSWYNKDMSQEIKVPPVMANESAEFVLEDEEHDDQGPDLSSFSVLDAETLSEVREDLRRTSLPSWLERPPHNFGSPSHGKLKADQWRTVCSVSLIITLIRLWGTASAGIREKSLLKNFTDMVVGIKWGTRRTTSPERNEIYSSHMKRYLESLKELFGEGVIVPNHHLSLHLVECLRLFGPVHSWWTFPFERYNGMLRHLNTNSKPGEIEKTFFRYFPMGANLRALFADMEWPDGEEYQNLKNKFTRAFDYGTRGTLITDILSWGSSVKVSAPKVPNVTTLDDGWYTRLLQRMNADADLPYVPWNSPGTSNPLLSNRVQMTNNITISGVKFSPSKGDAYILYRSPNSSVISAGKIEKVFLQMGNASSSGQNARIEPYLAVQEYDTLSVDHQSHDPFRQIPYLEANLCYNSFKGPRVLKASDVVSHFASMVYTPAEIGRECIIVLSLDRLNPFLLAALDASQE